MKVEIDSGYLKKLCSEFRKEEECSGWKCYPPIEDWEILKMRGIELIEGKKELSGVMMCDFDVNAWVLTDKRKARLKEMQQDNIKQSST